MLRRIPAYTVALAHLAICLSAEAESHGKPTSQQQANAHHATPHHVHASNSIGSALGQVLSSPNALTNPFVMKNVQNLSNAAAAQKLAVEAMYQNGDITQGQRDGINAEMASSAMSGFEQGSENERLRSAGGETESGDLPDQDSESTQTPEVPAEGFISAAKPQQNQSNLALDLAVGEQLADIRAMSEPENPISSVYIQAMPVAASTMPNLLTPNDKPVGSSTETKIETLGSHPIISASSSAPQTADGQTKKNLAMDTFTMAQSLKATPSKKQKAVAKRELLSTQAALLSKSAVALASPVRKDGDSETFPSRLFINFDSDSVLGRGLATIASSQPAMYVAHHANVSAEMSVFVFLLSFTSALVISALFVGARFRRSLKVDRS